MKTFKNYFYLMVVALLPLPSCDENEPNVPQASTIRVVNTIQGIGDIDLRDFQGSFMLSGSDKIGYGLAERFTVIAGSSVPLDIVPTSDTLNTIFSDVLEFPEPGSITSVYLTGDSIDVQAFQLQEQFTNYSDSIFGVRFIHASDDTEPVSIRSIQIDTTGVADTTTVFSSLAFQSGTEFFQFEATSRIDDYTFQYLDATDNVLQSVTINPLQNFQLKVFKNISVALIGRTDDSSSSSSLGLIRYDNFR